MKLEHLFNQAVKTGIDRDQRGRAATTRLLVAENEKFKGLKPEDQVNFDPCRLSNPFADSRILWGDKSAAVRKVLAGIDIEVGEILLAYLLNRDKGAKIDLILSHHPMGAAQAQLHDVMRLQAALLAKYGVTVSVAEQLMEKRIGEVERRLLPINHMREVDVARVLGIPLICLHTPADNCVVHHLTALFAKKKPATLKDLMAILKSIPEYARAAKQQVPAKIVSGAEANSCGKIFVDMTGGTEGSKDIFDKIAAGGISTLVGMHFSEDHLANAKKANLNVVVAGHISSDTLGLNLLLDEVEKKERLEYVCVGGFERIRR